MLGWVAKWKTTFREYSGVVVEWVVDDAEAKACVDGFKCMVYENITDELYHFNGDDKHQLSFVRPSIKDYVEYKRRVFLRANSGNVVMEVDNPSKTEPATCSVESIRTIHDAIIEELCKLDDIRILKQRQDAIKNELTLKSITMKNLKVQELNKSIIIPHLSSKSSRESSSISGKTVSEAVDSVSHGSRRDDDENTTAFISESDGDEDDDSDADSSDVDDDDDDDEEDDDDDRDGKIDVKVKISTTNELRGFSIRLNERGLGKVFAAVRRDYDFKPALYFVDRDGDRISIKTIDDLRYAHRSCSATNIILKLMADTLEKEKPASSRALKIERVASKRIVFVDSPLSPQDDDDRQTEAKSDAVHVSSSPTTGASKQFEVLWKKGELVGRGSFGKVYSGINLTTGERIAVKEVRVRRSKRNKQHLKALQQEIRILGSLEHRNIIKYLGTEFTNYTLRIFLELATDGTIKDAIKEFGPFPEPLMRRFTTDILDGLEYLHSKNFIHRDIKPTNLLVSGGIVKLGDFGCSSIMIDGNDSEEVANKTMAGTAIYMAPEVIYAGNNDDLCEAAISHSLTQTPLEQAPLLKEATLRITKSIGSAKASQVTGYGRLADIWSLGATLFEMATGRPPYPNAGAAIYAIAVSKKFPVFPDLFSMEAHNFLGR
jgi:tRNA A-37 threonylcarbamoyl transferase component Bud32